MSKGRIVVVWVLAFCFAAVAVGLELDVPDLLRLTHDHATAAGSVLRLVPDSHGMVEVQYDTSGQVYRKKLLPGRMLIPGDSVVVYYLPSDPAVASLTPPAEQLSDNLAFGWVVSLPLSFCLTFMISQLPQYKPWFWRFISPWRQP